MTTPEEGSWKEKNYKERATSIQYDHLSLVLPELKGHAAPTQRDRLLEREGANLLLQKGLWRRPITS